MNRDVKRIIKVYAKSEKIDTFISKVAQKEFNSYTKQLFLYFVKTNNYNSEMFLRKIINYFNQLLETEITFNIIENNLLSIKAKSVFINIPQTHKLNEQFLWLLNDLSYKKLLDYILYLDKEISEINYKKINYPYLDNYNKVTDYNILLHYSNLVE